MSQFGTYPDYRDNGVSPERAKELEEQNGPYPIPVQIGPQGKAEAPRQPQYPCEPNEYEAIYTRLKYLEEDSDRLPETLLEVRQAEEILSLKAPRQSVEDSLEFAKSIDIAYCADLAEEGSPWEVPAEPEPEYFATLQEAIVFLVNLLKKECDKLEAELREPRQPSKEEFLTTWPEHEKGWTQRAMEAYSRQVSGKEST